MSTATALPARSSPWIAGARFDLVFFIGSGLLGFAILGACAIVPSFLTLLVCAIVSIFLDQVHVFHTVSRTYLDMAEFRRARRFYVGSIIAVFLLLVSVWAAGAEYALSLVLYGSTWHQTKQHYGFVRLYDRRRMHAHLGRVDTWLDNFCLFGGVLAGVMYLFRFEGLGEVGLRIVYPHIPPMVAESAMALVGVGFLLMAARETYRFRRFGEVAAQKCLVMAMAVGLIWGAVALGSELIVVLVAVTSFHAVQYIAITWLNNQNKYRDGESQDNPVTSRLIVRRRWWLFYGLGIIYGAVAIGFLQRIHLLIPLAYTFTFLHFVVDARIWKVKYCPDLRRNIAPPL